MSIQIKIALPFIISIVFLIILSIMVFAKLAMATRPSSGYSTFEKIVLKGKDANSRSCYCVAFRLDDIMDYSVTNPLIEVMNVFKENNADLTIGIIGDRFGNDERLVSYIKERIVNGNNSGIKDAIEIANHSWNHEHFSNLTVDEMSDSIRKTNQKIKNIFGITPTVFLAPFNEFNNDIFVALHENNIVYFSAAEKTDLPPYSIYANTPIYHLPQTGYTGNCKICGEGVKNASWYAVPHEKTLSQINRSLNKYGFAVVTLHPWEYSPGHDEWIFNNEIDVKQIRELRLLLNEIQKEGLKIVPISKIVDYVR